MGIFGDIFNDDDFEIKDEEEIVMEEDNGEDDDWGSGGATWDTGQKPDIWNADEPWTCDDDCDDDCDGSCDQDSFNTDDFFS